LHFFCHMQTAKQQEGGVGEIDCEPLTDFSLAEGFHQQYIADGGDVEAFGFNPPEAVTAKA
jgi:hypothetical protein